MSPIPLKSAKIPLNKKLQNLNAQVYIITLGDEVRLGRMKERFESFECFKKISAILGSELALSSYYKYNCNSLYRYRLLLSPSEPGLALSFQIALKQMLVDGYE